MAAARIQGAQRPSVLDYRNTTDSVIPAMTILQIGDIVGVAGTAIEPGALGSAYIEGVFFMPKAAGAEIKQGDKVAFDGNEISAGGASGSAGVAAYDAAASDSVVAVVLNV